MTNLKARGLILAGLALISIGFWNVVEAQETTPQVRTIRLVLNNFGFNATKGGPDIVVNQGDTVRITLVSNSTFSHDWVLDSNSPSPYNVKSVRIRTPGNSTLLEFVAATTGIFKAYCSVTVPTGPSHRQRGMEHNIIVNPRAAPADLSGQVRGLEDQVRSLSTSVSSLTAEQNKQKSALEAMSSQSAMQTNLSLAATAISVVAVVLAAVAMRKKAPTSG